MFTPTLVTTAPVDPAERASAVDDYEKALESKARAAKKVTTFEVATVAQIAHEHGFAREDLMVLEVSGRGLFLESIEPDVDEEDEASDVPAVWSEDLIDWHDYRETMGEPQRRPGYLGVYELTIGEALDAEAELLGKDWATRPGAFADRRGTARSAWAQARDEAVVAAAHVLMLDVLREVPLAREIVLSYDEHAQTFDVAEVLGPDGHAVDLDNIPFDVVDNPLSYANPWDQTYFTPADLARAGIAREGLAEGTQVLSCDVVRRMRGVADDPNQPSLFGADSAADYGWLGRAA